MSATNDALIDALLSAVPRPALLCTPAGDVVACNAGAKRLLAGTNAAGPPGANVLDDWPSDALRQALHAAPDAPPTVVALSDASADDLGALVVQPAPPYVLLSAAPEAAPPRTSRVLRDLIEAMREPLASVRAAVETMTHFPSIDTAAATQFLQIIEEQTVRLSDQLEAAVSAYAAHYRASTYLQPMNLQALADLVASAGAPAPHAIHRADDARVVVAVHPSTFPPLVSFLVRRVRHATQCPKVTLHIVPREATVALDLRWTGPAITTARLQRWHGSPLPTGDTLVELTVQDVLDDHEAQLWPTANASTAAVRLLLPTERVAPSHT
ncbi:sensor histidine kinase family protein [Salisaeta longa]|uniref:hypothetical protein n=1 Tax=Salisaeta longa TaxID=503170 RepID=UPI00146C0A97|nr:hypothetical protein [Salisaeta longa]